MSDPLKFLSETFLTRSIFENTLVTIVVSAPLSVYLAFLVNRLATFRQIKLSAINEIALIKRTIAVSENYGAAHIHIRWSLELPVIALADEEQWNALRTVVTIRGEMRDFFTTGLDQKSQNQGMKKREAFSGAIWLEAQNQFWSESKTQIKDWVIRMQRLRPDVFCVLGLVPRNETLNRWEKYRFGRVAVAFFDLLRHQKSTLRT